eukprot:Clim_evm104s157 gene=Clim_evmTU104s157
MAQGDLDKAHPPRLLTATRTTCRSIKAFDDLKQIGLGTYGQVFKGAQDDGTPVALKKIKLENQKDGFPITAIREIKLLSRLNHKNLVSLLEIVTDQGKEESANGENDHINPLKLANLSLYLVFEYCDYDLSGLLRSGLVTLSELQVKSYTYQMLQGLLYLHDAGILHRDIKASNMLLSRDGQLKVADFGLARYAENRDQRYTNHVITLWYRPPELLLGTNSYSYEVDMWSMGCLITELFLGSPPFPGNDEPGQLKVVFKITGKPTEKNWPGCSMLPNFNMIANIAPYERKVQEKFEKLPPAALNLVDELLVLDPRNRLTAKEALEHEFFDGYDGSLVPIDNLPADRDLHEYSIKMEGRRMSTSHKADEQHSTGDGGKMRNTGGSSRESRSQAYATGGDSVRERGDRDRENGGPYGHDEQQHKRKRPPPPPPGAKGNDRKNESDYHHSGDDRSRGHGDSSFGRSGQPYGRRRSARSYSPSRSRSPRDRSPRDRSPRDRSPPYRRRERRDRDRNRPNERWGRRLSPREENRDRRDQNRGDRRDDNYNRRGDRDRGRRRNRDSRDRSYSPQRRRSLSRDSQGRIIRRDGGGGGAQKASNRNRRDRRKNRKNKGGQGGQGGAAGSSNGSGKNTRGSRDMELSPIRDKDESWKKLVEENRRKNPQNRDGGGRGSGRDRDTGRKSRGSREGGTGRGSWIYLQDGGHRRGTGPSAGGGDQDTGSSKH